MPYSPTIGSASITTVRWRSIRCWRPIAVGNGGGRFWGRASPRGRFEDCAPGVWPLREGEKKFLQGTGSVVLDRTHRVAYACSSPRTDLDVLGEFAQQLDYELMTFDALDGGGRAIYHTNVLMAIGTGFAVICGESIANAAHRAAVLSKLRATGHDVVDITQQQMAQFAGNVLELASPTAKLIALSMTALDSLNRTQLGILESHAALLPVAIPTIERVGGGGVRCMLA